ncbi:hypothetical protein C0992_010111 [Termitomyces sp. T32_za158]|nr:hypothetical protein C0992_010111 [Termitomyces sp. T32_za158]
MQPVVSYFQSNQVQAHPQSVPASFNTSVQQQYHTPTQSDQRPAVPNFVTSRVQTYQARKRHCLLFNISSENLSLAPPSGSTSGVSDPSKMTVSQFGLLSAALDLHRKQTSQPPLSTAVPLPKVPATPDGTELGATTVNVQGELVDSRTPSQSNLVSVLQFTGGSSQEIDPPVDVTASWRHFSQSIESWARIAPPSTEMPLINTKIKVVKDANSQVFIAIPGTDGHKPMTMTLQTLLSSLLHNSKKSSTPKQEITANPNDPASRKGDGYRPNMSTNNLEKMASPARITPSTDSSAVLSSSERTPSQANKKSLAKDILRALGFSSLKRSQPDDPSALRTSEPPAKRHASGITSQTSNAVDVIPQASIENVERPSQTADTYPPQAQSDQATLASVSPESPVPSTIPSESALVQSSNSHLITAPNTNQPHASSIETTLIAPTPQAPQNLSPKNDDMQSVTENLFSGRSTTPLFLPSLSSSPIAGPSDEIPTDLNRNAVRHARWPTQSFCILVPPNPIWLKQYKAQQSRKKGWQFVGESERESSSGGISSDKETTSLGRYSRAEGDEIEDEDNDVIDLDPANNLATDEFEREAILLSCSRIREQFCKWNSCNVVLNSAEKLIRHLAYAHQELFEEFSVYCKESFRTPRQLVKHHRNVHRNNSPKPSDTPFAPTLKTPPPASPLVLPSYLMEPIQRPSMTKERHGSLGPWVSIALFITGSHLVESYYKVLRQIAGPVNHEIKRYNAASKLLQSPSRSDQQGYQPYDFLSFPSTNYSSAPSLPSKIRGMEDLSSGEVSDMVRNGLVLWGPHEEEEEDELSLPSSPLPQRSSHEKATMEEEINSVQLMLEN